MCGCGHDGFDHRQIVLQLLAKHPIWQPEAADVQSAFEGTLELEEL